MSENGEDAEEVEEVPQPTEAVSSEQPAPAVVEAEMQAPAMSNPPLDSRIADAEEALFVQDQAGNAGSDDVESFLKELHENEDNAGASSESGEKEGKDREEDEGSAETELMQVANENQGTDEGEVESGEYTQNLLNLLLHEGE